jgi:Zn-dependent alcohol dehydrogenase
VGLNVIQGAVLASAERIIAVGLVAKKLDFAKSFGATDLVNASEVDPVEAVRELTQGQGVDYAFEVIGNC